MLQSAQHAATRTPSDACQDGDYICSTWFERGRANVRLETPRGRTVLDLWDDELEEAIADGFLSTPRVPRASDVDWQPHVVAYARDRGLIR